MSDLYDILLILFRGVFKMFSFGKNTLDNSLKIFVKSNSGNTLTVGVDPQWDIKNVKNIIAPQLGANPEEVKIILAGKELEDSFIIADCDLGEQSILHAVKLKNPSIHAVNVVKKSSVSEVIEDRDERQNELHESSQQRKTQFYVYCAVCSKLRTGKLRVRCSSCKSGAITLDSDPKSWNDVLKPKKISGHCEQDDCPDGVFGWGEFYFKCAEHVSQGEDDTAVPLHLIRNNMREVPCLACTQINDIVVVFSCDEAHVTCLDCFIIYTLVRLRERQFILDENVGYTISCPAGCPNSLIDECHHFKLFSKEDYEMYQRFATEECVLKAGGVLCPQPGCGEGIIIDKTGCDKVVCSNGCGFVFCKKCLQGYHIGDCSSVDNTATSDVQSITDPLRAAQARWDEDSRLAIRTTTKPCPKCRTATERSGGCMHMVCTRCTFHWCWICQTEWNRECMGAHWFG